MKQLIIAVLLVAGTAFAQEDRFIATLKSDAPPKEKADACRELARVGTRQAVPVLATLLVDETLSHMARYALEPIADPSVNRALRKALDQLKGPLLVGVIDSLGVRQDTEAVEALAKFLADTDPVVVQAAARALGRIGGPAAQVLQISLAHMSNGAQANRLAVCEGLLRCAEVMPDAEATDIYDKLRTLPNWPHQVQVAALRGAILRRGARGVPLMVETIRTGSAVLTAVAMGISMDIPGEATTMALTGELAQANPQTRLLLIQTLGHRGDPTAVPTLMPLAQTGSALQRSAAVRSLAQLGDPSALPVLVALMKESDATVSNAAQAALIGFPGNGVDAAIVVLLNQSRGKIRVAAIDVASQRRSFVAVPSLMNATGDANLDVVKASFKAIGELAGVAQIPAVVDAMLKTRAVTAAEAALTALCARQADRTGCTDTLLPGLYKAQGKPKLALLRVLRTVGDVQALTAVRAAATESDTFVRETALRALCYWPTADALPDVAHIAKTSEDRTFRILALRGQLRLIPLQTVSDAQKLAQLKELLPLIDRTEEQRLVLATLGGLPSAESLALVMTYLPQKELTDEASVAAVGIAEKIIAAHPEEVAAAMEQVLKSNNKLADRVQKLLASVPATK
jgi:HEAT repeat protein